MKDGWKAWSEIRKLQCEGCGAQVGLNVPVDGPALAECVPPLCPNGCWWVPGKLKVSVPTPAGEVRMVSGPRVTSEPASEPGRKPELPGWPKMTAEQQAEVDHLELGLERLSHEHRAKVFKTLADCYRANNLHPPLVVGGFGIAMLFDHIADAHARAHVSEAGARALKDFQLGVRRE